MKSFSLLSLALMLCSFAVLSQDAVTVGTPYAVADAAGKFYFTHNGEILAVKEGRSDVILQKMNAQTLGLLEIHRYTDFPEAFNLKTVEKINGRYYVFYYLSGDTQRPLFVREIDFASGTFSGPAQKIATIDGQISDGFTFEFSYDSSQMLIRYRLDPEKKRDAVSYDIIGMHVLDAGFQEKWAKKVTMPYTEKKMNNLDYSVDAHGNVYIAARVFSDNTTNEKNKDDEANYKIEILKVAAGTGVITSTKVDVAGTFIETVWIYETAQGTLLGAGLYNKGNEAGNADGIVLMKFGVNGELSDMKTYEFPLELLNQYVSAKSKRKNEKKEADGEAELQHIQLQEVLIQPDGSVVVVGEQQYMIERVTDSRTRPGSMNSSYTSFYNDMLVAKIDAAGNLGWMKKLPKRQRSGFGEGGLSYRYLRGSDAHFLLFLDNEKNKDLLPTQEPEYHVAGQGGYLTAYKVNDKTGEVTKLSLLNLRDVKGLQLRQFSVGRMLTTEPNALVFECYKGDKQDVLVKVVLDK